MDFFIYILVPETPRMVKLFLDNCTLLVEFSPSPFKFKEVKTMAVPKKKASRSRRDMRRYSAAYALDPISETTCKFTHTPVRSHTISMKAVKEGLYEAGKKTKAARA